MKSLTINMTLSLLALAAQVCAPRLAWPLAG
jgi:hypothetical protein